jgi:hypothetical protein
MTTFDVEYTDTFAGEANYSWVRRAEIELPEGATDRQLVRAAKAAIGLTGVRCRKEDYGDSVTLRPIGSCTVVFINTRY